MFTYLNEFFLRELDPNDTGERDPQEEPASPRGIPGSPDEPVDEQPPAEGTT